MLLFYLFRSLALTTVAIILGYNALSFQATKMLVISIHINSHITNALPHNISHELLIKGTGVI